MDVDITEYYSHPKRNLHVHISGVLTKAKKRVIPLRDAKLERLIWLAVIFHDLGKLNKEFQRKLKPNERKIGYSSHSYISALAWLCFERENQHLSDKWQLTPADTYIIAALIARHHGHLPNLKTLTARIFNNQSTSNNDPTTQLTRFLGKTSESDLPLSDYLRCTNLLDSTHNPFSIITVDEYLRDAFLNVNLYGVEVDDALETFINTQFGFAALIEADKRDAGYNEQYNKEERGADFKRDFTSRLAEKLDSLNQKSSEVSNDKLKKLNCLRTKMREEAAYNLRGKLNENLMLGYKDKKRVFSLSAPTGAGKTFMLLRLAAEILKHDQPHENQMPLGIIYALPFLSITEQTEAICKGIMHNQDDAVMRVDSKARNRQIEDLQQHLEENFDDEKLSELMSEIFSEDTFDHPFIITTFVQVFETLISNRNATLLRLPNFSRAIFLIDEIQALPPRLYTFFTAYLEEFCRKFDSYAIISTATMPALDMRSKGNADINPALLFKRYQKPCELLNENHFANDIFNRYRIKRLAQDGIIIDALANEISNQEKSCLIILNTIKDTQELYDKLSYEHADKSCSYILLNTLFTPRDRQEKLAFCKSELELQRADKSYKRRVVLISTQLIEAGVDIDFPVLYRDMCPLPNLIQSAGRCNRNGLDECGEVHLFELKRKGGKSQSEIIYGRSLDWFLTFTKDEVENDMTEKEMFDVQRKFFNKVNSNEPNEGLTVGLHEPEHAPSFNMVSLINELAFEQLGRFRLIDRDAHRMELRYFIPHDKSDHQAFDDLKTHIAALRHIYKTRDFKQIKQHKSKVEIQLRKMSSQIINVKIAARDLNNAPSGEEEAGIRKLADSDYYSLDKGFITNPIGGCFIDG